MYVPKEGTNHLLRVSFDAECAKMVVASELVLNVNEMSERNSCMVLYEIQIQFLAYVMA